MEKFSLTDIKKMNYSDVFHYIYHHPQSSKQSIAVALKMSLPTVSQHLNSMMEQGLIKKCGQLESQIGRKAAAYSIVPDARITFGLEVLKERVLITAVDLYGEQIDRENLFIEYENTDSYYQNICSKIQVFVNKLQITGGQILGVGFGLQGLVNQDGSEIIYGKILNCTGLSIDVFGRHLDYPCRFFHDSECAAMSQLWETPDITDALYLSIGHHLGGAVILNGKISSGRTGRTGTIEHMTLIKDGIDCYCGQKGCMECYCSADALLQDTEDLDTFFRIKAEGDSDAIARWDSFLQYLAIAINNLHMVVDISIILGGQMGSYLTDDDIRILHRNIQEHTAFPEEDIFIIQGQRRKHAIAIGAALPFITDYLSSI